MTTVPITGQIEIEGDLPEGVTIVGGLTLGLNLAITNAVPPAGGGGAPAAFAEDSFTDTSGVLLENHTPEVGGSWVKHPASLDNFIISNANRCRNQGANVPIYYASATPESADYSVFADFVIVTNIASIVGLIGRADPTVHTMYIVRHDDNANAWQLLRYLAGAGTVPANVGGHTLAPGSYRVELRMIGDQITVLVDDVSVIDVTNADISAAGHAGVYASAAVTDTTGMHLDNFLAVNA